MRRWFSLAMPVALVAVVLGAGFALGQTDKEPEKLYRHVVCFKFKDDADADQVQGIVKAFQKLPPQIDTIHDFEYGTDVSPEGLAKGFTHCFLVTFKDKKGLDAYLPHAAHQAFVKELRPILDDVFVIDYVTEN